MRQAESMHDNNVYLRLGRQIKKLRQEKKWNQEELSYQSQISSSHLGHIERGEQNPTVETLQKIADGLQVEIAELFNFEDSYKKKTPPNHLRLQKKFLSMNEKQQLNFVKAMNSIIDMMETMD